MGILRQKRFKLALSFAMVGIAVAVAAVFLGPSVVDAKRLEIYEQASSAKHLKQARGTVDALADTTPVGQQRLVSGVWTLKCHKQRAKAKMHEIEFDMGFAMRKTDGGGLHSHQFSGFSATEVVLDGDNLTIEGTITGSGEIGPEVVTIRLVAIADGNASFYFKMNAGNSILSELGGAIVESRQEDRIQRRDGVSAKWLFGRGGMFEKKL